MSDYGEKTCPLCAGEMDLTDQQLKPCKCGYQICVWCWHHIMDMAEKDHSEGRCPACRTPYDKEKIVGMTVDRERLASEGNMDRKKTQKSKLKPSEGRKQLTSVRVVQRNLVYIVGLPLNLADEDLLQRKEYFGQYGKVLKVSMSRTAMGLIQQFPNNTCSVYITYGKEEEAVRCIQSVHGFILDGKALKACFGTTKYCHAWLRNVACNNPDCLYLHEVGSQEDSFTKDEIISAYTRVQQITGASNTMQYRSGSMLPPPLDAYCSDSSTAKPIAKVPSTTAVSAPKGSPPSGSSGKSTALPAAASCTACMKLEEEEGSARKAFAEQEAIMEKVVQESKLLQQEAEENSKVPTSAAPAKPMFRHEFYQKPEEAVVTIFAKGIPKQNVTVEFGEQILSVVIDVAGEEAYHLQPRLFGKIIPEKCRYEVLSTKVEIHLAKAEIITWASLEYGKGQTVLPKPNVSSEAVVDETSKGSLAVENGDPELGAAEVAIRPGWVKHSSKCKNAIDSLGRKHILPLEADDTRRLPMQRTWGLGYYGETAGHGGKALKFVRPEAELPAMIVKKKQVPALIVKKRTNVPSFIVKKKPIQLPLVPYDDDEDDE